MLSWWSGLTKRLESRGWFFKVWGKTIGNHVKQDFNPFAQRFFDHPEVDPQSKFIFRQIFMERDNG